MLVDAGLPSMLSQMLVAFTIEFDNEFEHQMPHRTARGPAAGSTAGPWLVSMAMWANFMRYIDPDGTPFSEVEPLARITNLGGLKRWGYVVVNDEGVRGEVVRPTRAGRAAQEIWRPLTGVIETRWEQRFGRAEVEDLRESLRALNGQFRVPLPRYLPVSGVATDRHQRRQSAQDDWNDVGELDLTVLLCHALQTYTQDYQQLSRLSLALSANVLRILDPDGVRVRDVPLLAGVSKEASSGSLKFLERHGLLTIGTDPVTDRWRTAVLSERGAAARRKYYRLRAAVAAEWQTRYGAQLLDDLSNALRGILDQRDDRGGSRLAQGLVPYPDGWRAHPPYLTQTSSVLQEPVAALPHHPMVSHRGGFPDGS